MTSIHDFKVEGIDGTVIDFKNFEGKKILIVNVASECGFTPQYQQLQEMSEMFEEKLVVIGFPSNDFGGQEPGSHTEIQQFCSLNYGVKFPLTEKVSIISSEVHPIYKWLTTKSLNQKLDAEVNWNFCKFILDENGQLLAFFPSATEPASPEILNLISA